MTRTVLPALVLLLTAACAPDSHLDGLEGGAVNARKAEKADVCHWASGDEEYVQISVSVSSAHLDPDEHPEDVLVGDWFPDADLDGQGDSSADPSDCPEALVGWVTNYTDCDDGDEAVYGGAAESCGDGVDNDCDGDVDEDCCPCTEYAEILASYGGSHTGPWDFALAYGGDRTYDYDYDAAPDDYTGSKQGASIAYYDTGTDTSSSDETLVYASAGWWEGDYTHTPTGTRILLDFGFCGLSWSSSEGSVHTSDSMALSSLTAEEGQACQDELRTIADDAGVTLQESDFFYP